MNALFGIFHLDGAPVEQDDLARMQASLAFWGKDGATIWQNGAIGMGCLFQNHTPEGVGEEMPLHDTERGLTLMASARLINRRELAERLNLPAASAEEADAVLVLVAYKRWGAECVDHLEGDWHFAVWHAQERRLFLACDHHGTSSVYYHHTPGFFAFASTQKPLLALHQISKQPNLLRIAKILTSWREDEQTAYRNIFRLLPAHYMNVDERGVQKHRYWFPEHLPNQYLASDDAYTEALFDIFSRAVYGRMRRRGSLGVMLSGGLDSGAIASLAAHRLRNTGELLHAFTSVPITVPPVGALEGRLADEGPAAAMVATSAGNVILERIPADVSPLAGMERTLHLHDEPSYASGNSFWLHEVFRAAQAQGVTILFSGAAGNWTFSWAGVPPALLHHLLSGSFVNFRKELEAVCRRTATPMRQVLSHFLIKPLVRGLRSRLKAPFLPKINQTLYDRTPIHPAFVKLINLEDAIAGADPGPNYLFTGNAHQRRWHFLAPGVQNVGNFQFEDGGAYGFDLLDPTADRRLIEFCASVPTEQYHNGFQNRWLIRRAMRGYLPDEVRLQRKRGIQAADIIFRVHNHHAEFADALSRLQRHPLASEVLDLDRMAIVLQRIEQSPADVSYRECNRIFLDGIMTGLFLLRF